MQTQCPHCQKTSAIPDTYKNRTIKCSGCKQPFKAVPYQDVIVAKIPPDPNTVQLKKDHIASTGRGCQILGILFIIGGVSASFVYPMTGPIFLIGGTILAALGMVINRLDRIVHDLKKQSEK